jgi:hypothetical protein
MWQPIETAPKDGTHVLAFRAVKLFEPAHHYWIVRWGSCTGKLGLKRAWVMLGKNTKVAPTHWMPLPEPPKGE